MLTREEIARFEIDPAVRFCFDYILPISDNRVLATLGDEISLITKDGDMICTYDSIEVPTYDSDTESVYSESENCEVAKVEYIDDILLILQDGLWGLIDYDGNVIADPIYRLLRFVSENELESFT